MKKIMDCGCVMMFGEDVNEPFIIYCPEHAGRDASPRASEIIKLAEGVDSIAGRLKEDINLLMSSGAELTQFIKNLKGGKSEDNEEGTGGADK